MSQRDSYTRRLQVARIPRYSFSYFVEDSVGEEFDVRFHS